MTLQETVSKILKKEVSLEEAKTFANEQFGVLSAFMEKDMVKIPTQQEIDDTKIMIIKNYSLHNKGALTYQDEENIKLYVEEDHVDEIGQKFFLK